MKYKYVTQNPNGTGYELQFDLDEDTNNIYVGGFSYGLAFPHLYYEDALYEEVEDQLK